MNRFVVYYRAIDRKAMLVKLKLPLLFVALITGIVVFSGCAVPLSRINGDAATGDVVIECEPEDAKVFLDGFFVGKAKKFSTFKNPLKVTVGAHVLEFEKEGYQHELREVMTRPDAVKVILKMQLRPVPPPETDDEE